MNKERDGLTHTLFLYLMALHARNNQGLLRVSGHVNANNWNRRYAT
jgi:hypothetical protein